MPQKRTADPASLAALTGLPTVPLLPTLTCPGCGSPVPLTEALVLEISRPLLDGREAEVREQAQQEARAEIARQLEDQTRRADGLAEDLAARDRKIEDLQNQEIALRKERRALADEKAGWLVERERMRDAITAEVTAKATKAAEDAAAEDRKRRDAEHEAKVRVLTEQLARVQDQLADAERKARTGRRQEEGYARQEVFRDELAARFPGDQVSVIKRGAKGGDVRHEVYAGGQLCGVILWECKDTAAWQASWPAKLADDVQTAGAAAGVLVSTVLPADAEGCTEIDGMLVCGWEVAAVLAAGLRRKVISDRWHEITASTAAGGRDRLYRYILTGDFVARYVALGRQIAKVREDIEAEDRAAAMRRRRQLRRLQDMTDTLAVIPLEIQDAIGADTDLPAGLRADAITGDVLDELDGPNDPPALPGPGDKPTQP